MAMTLNSGFAYYCTPAQFVSLFDYRPFSQYCVDNDIAPTSSAVFQASAVLDAKLRVASGHLEMAATKDAKYDQTDLAKLITPNGSGIICNGGWALIAIVAGDCAFEIVGRRMEAMPQYMTDMIERSQTMLEALENGAMIFPFAEAQQAGIVRTYKETPQDVANRNLPSLVARPLFGQRDNMIPYGGS